MIFHLLLWNFFYRTRVPLQILLLAIKVLKFLCMSQKLCKLRPKETTMCERTQETEPQNCWCPSPHGPMLNPKSKTSLQNAAVIMTDAQRPGLPIACSSYFEVMVLLIFWFSDYRGRGGLKKWSLSVVFMPVSTALSKCVWVSVCTVHGMTKIMIFNYFPWYRRCD